MGVYVSLMVNRNPLDASVIERHVAYLKRLDQEGSLILCGPFIDEPGGMVVFSAGSMDEAKKIAQNDPFIHEGYKTHTLRTMEIADASNDYLL